MDQVLDSVIVVMGIYVIWAAITLKTRGKINPQVMKSPNKDPKNIRDAEGFRKFIYPRCLLMGILVVLLGLFGFAQNSLAWFSTHGAASSIMEVVFLLAVVVYMFWYAHEIKVAEGKFY